MTDLERAIQECYALVEKPVYSGGIKYPEPVDETSLFPSDEEIARAIPRKVPHLVPMIRTRASAYEGQVKP